MNELTEIIILISLPFVVWLILYLHLKFELRQQAKKDKKELLEFIKSMTLELEDARKDLREEHNLVDEYVVKETDEVK